MFKQSGANQNSQCEGERYSPAIDGQGDKRQLPLFCEFSRHEFYLQKQKPTHIPVSGFSEKT
jgi:hypothetical protein